MQFHINLIKNKVLSPEKRKKVFLAITAYLAVCGLIFIILLLWMAKSFIGIHNLRKEVASLENKLNQSPGRRNLSEYNEELRIEIAQYLNKLQAIDGILSRTVDTKQILQRISKTLPRGSYLDNFNLDDGKKTLSFDIISLVGKDGQSADISKLITVWKKDSVLMSAIENINSSHSQRQKKGEDLVLISKFNCVLVQ